MRNLHHASSSNLCHHVTYGPRPGKQISIHSPYDPENSDNILNHASNMQLILEEKKKIDILNYKHSKVKHKMCDPTQCKIIHPVILKMFGIKILTLLVLSLTSFMFHLKISPNCTEMADHAFTTHYFLQLYSVKE